LFWCFDVVVAASSEPWAFSKDGSSWFQGKNNLSFTNFCNFVAMSNEIQFVSGGKNVLLNINSINND